jgi:hypothetical protein
MVGNYFRISSFISAVNLKRKQALLESNLPAIRLMQDNSEISSHKKAAIFGVIGLLYGLKKLIYWTYS